MKMWQIPEENSALAFLKYVMLQNMTQKLYNEVANKQPCKFIMLLFEIKQGTDPFFLLGLFKRYYIPKRRSTTPHLEFRFLRVIIVFKDS